jgi:hypothetical protein
MRRLVTHALGLDERQLLAWLEGQRGRRLDDTQLRGMQRRNLALDGARGIEAEVISLLLSDPATLRERLQSAVEQVPAELEVSLLREFAAICEEERFDANAVLARYREREEGELLFARALEGETVSPERRAQIQRHLDTSLSRLREVVLERDAAPLRTRLQERIAQLTARLDAPDVDEATLKAYYAELGELQAALSAREAERRVRVRRSHVAGRRR